MVAANKLPSNTAARIMLLGYPGCLAGHEEIRVLRAGHSRAYPIRKIYEMQNGGFTGSRHWDKAIPTHLLSWDGDVVVKNLMTDIMSSGVKPYTEVRCEDGRVLHATDDHRVLTPDGWARIKDKPSHLMLRNFDYGTEASTQRSHRVSVSNIPFHPNKQRHMQNGADYGRQARARLVVEAGINNLDYDDFIGILRHNKDCAAGLQYLATGLEVHHIDNNPTNDELTNLKIVTLEQHLVLHRKPNPQKQFGNLCVEPLACTYKPKGIVDTYDVSMACPNHNYLTNAGFIVHNSGKTGALACLANAGYKLRILDYDGNLEPLLLYTDKDKLKNIDVIQLEDKLRSGPQFIEAAGIPKAFAEGVKLMDHWKYNDPETGEEIDLGSSKDWGPDTVLVIDSLTAMGIAAKRRSMKMLNKTPLNTTQQTWGLAMEDQESFVEKLTSPSNKFHVIVLSHLKLVGPKDIANSDADLTKELKERAADIVPTRIYPSALGQALPPAIGGHFPTVLLADWEVKGKDRVRRFIRTIPKTELDLKCPVKNMPAEIDLSDGLLKVITALTKGETQ